MSDMYNNNDDVPIEHKTRTEDEVVMNIMMMKEQFAGMMTKGAAS